MQLLLQSWTLLLDSNYALGYQKLLNRITDPAWLMDRSGEIYLVNTAWENYTGRSLLTSEPSFLWDLMPKQAEIKAIWHNFAGTQMRQNKLQLKDAQGNYSLFDLELELLSPNDSTLLYIGTASVDQAIAKESDTSAIIEPDQRSQQAPSFHGGVICDLSDYKQKEIKLQRNTEFVRRIIESSPDCIKVVDLQGRLLYMNDGGQDIMEIDNFTQVQYLPWLSFWQGCDRSLAEKALDIAKAGKIARFDGYCATAKGTPRWWEVVVTPMLDENEQVQEILSVSRDITARKIAEQDLRKRNQELDRFSYIVSHDLKAPLRGIANLAQWISEDLGDLVADDIKEYLDLLGQRVKRMDALIDGLLKLSRSGRQDLPVESVDVTELLSEVIDSLSPPAGFKITSVALPILATQRLLLSQVLSNLIGNALKHHDRDTGQIEVTVRDCHTHYEFAIADDGPGIPPTERERIFEIFQTLENSSSTTNTGIGLALVKKIIEEAGGKLWLQENSPRGCKFCFTWAKSALNEGAKNVDQDCKPKDIDP
ncbi:MAG: ATP-binding protein [Pleurocapsa sp.]